MNFFVVFLESRRYKVVKRDWISNPVVNVKTTMFYSNNPAAVANFAMQPEYYFNPDNDACYNIYVVKSFGKFRFKIDSEIEAKTYASSKRVMTQVKYSTGDKFGEKKSSSETVAYIAISDDEVSIFHSKFP